MFAGHPRTQENLIKNIWRLIISAHLKITWRRLMSRDKRLQRRAQGCAQWRYLISATPVSRTLGATSKILGATPKELKNCPKLYISQCSNIFLFSIQKKNQIRAKNEFLDLKINIEPPGSNPTDLKLFLVIHCYILNTFWYSNVFSQSVPSGPNKTPKFNQGS